MKNEKLNLTPGRDPRMRLTLTIVSLMTSLLCIPVMMRAAEIGTAFTYQGQLQDGSSPAQGAYDFRFALYDDAAAGLQIGTTVTNQAVAVNGGVFTVLLDFGGSFDQARWLEIGVRTH